MQSFVSTAEARPISTGPALKDRLIAGSVETAWKAWKTEFHRVYGSLEEDKERFAIFAQNQKRVEKLNSLYASDPEGARFGLNQFADLSVEEFSRMYLHEIDASSIKREFLPPTNTKVSDWPEEKDWEADGAVTPVKNQGNCGSCWSFSVTGNAEGVYYVAKKELPVLSEQQFVDCDHDCMQYQGEQVCDSGCDGGLMPVAMQYAIREGIDTEESYPYKGTEKSCQHTAPGPYKFSKWAAVNGTEPEMIAALNTYGPLSVGVDANMWQFYLGGVFSLPCGKQLNHGVLLVGYGVTDKKKEFWKIKNSWGATWGEKGYIRLVREKDKCGVDNFVNTLLV